MAENPFPFPWEIRSPFSDYYPRAIDLSLILSLRIGVGIHVRLIETAHKRAAGGQHLRPGGLRICLLYTS